VPVTLLTRGRRLLTHARCVGGALIGKSESALEAGCRLTTRELFAEHQGREMLGEPSGR
jgi:hypothetical protein